MGYFSKNWTIDGVIAGVIIQLQAGRQYQVVFERENASLEDIEGINWAKPTIEYIGPHSGEKGLPEGYGFEVEKITYSSNTRSYTVHLKVGAEYLGDVTSYQAKIDALQAQLEELTAQKTAEMESTEETASESDTEESAEEPVSE